MKYLIGQVMSKNLSFCFLLSLIVFPSWGDITIPLPGVPVETSVLEESIKEAESGSPHVPGTTEETNVITDDKSVYLPSNDTDGDLEKAITLREELKNFGVTVPHSREGGESYQRLTNKDLLYRFQSEGTKSFSVFFIQDTYDVSDSAGVYQRTFGNDVSQAMRGGTLHVSMERFWVHSSVFIGWGANFGVGLAQGKGSFTSGGVSAEQSSTKFSLWTLPLDLGLVFEVPIGNWFKIGISGGPSAMGLYQHRDDKENGEGGKHLRQVSMGYYGRANLKISLSHMMPKQAINNMKAYNMTKMYLTLEARMQEFADFQDDLSISGNSFGLGFAFEYF